MHFLGATIIAGALFFVLNFLSSIWLGGAGVTTIGALIEAVVKTAVYATLFHYIHNFIAKLFRWYRTENPHASHTFDRNPALEEARAGRAKG
jgi:hypothetical protein